MLKTKANTIIRLYAIRLLALLIVVSLLCGGMTLNVHAAVTVGTASKAGNKIAGGDYYSLALKSDGTVEAWGDDEYDQCKVPSGLKDVVAIEVGSRHSLALKKDGTVEAWGGINDYGQCNVPSGLKNVVAISAGARHSLALKKDGTVEAWGGINDYGQCNVPSGLKDVVTISAGLRHSLALKKDGTVEAWGDSGVDQCDVPSGLKDVVAISAGELHSLALKKDGTVEAWGWNGYYQCNVPSGLKNVVAISAGKLHSLALKKDGTVEAWGFTFNGQHYDRCRVPLGLKDVVAIAAGGNHSLALKKDGTVEAWGWNKHGQCNVPSGLNLCEQLSSLLVDEGSLSPDFDPDILSYTLNLPNAVDSIGITPILADINNQLYIQGELKASGSTTDIPLNIGENTITIEDLESATGLVRTYTVTANRESPDSTNANLFKLEVGTGVLTPVFDPDTTSYTVSVDNLVSSVDITVCPEDTGATMTIKGQGVGGGEQIVAVSLDAGENTIPITVRGSDMVSTEEYTINVVRGPSDNADLNLLSVSSGTLDPVFSTDTVAYAVHSTKSADSDDLNSIEITAESVNPLSTITINNETRTGSAVETVTLNNGENLIPIVVTAQDRTTERAYILSVNGTVSDADLDSLTLNTKSESWMLIEDGVGTGSAINVGNDTEKINIAATSSDSKALVLINGSVRTNSAIELDVGKNFIDVMVVAQNANTKNYTVTVNRGKGNVNLSDITLSHGTLSPAFSKTKTQYTATVPYTTETIRVTPTLEDSGATVKVNGKDQSELVSLEVGKNTIEVVVKGKDSVSTKTYTITVTRKEELTCGNGAYIIKPNEDSAYTGGYTDNGLPTMEVNEGVSGFTYFLVTIKPVTGHSGNEICVFIHMRNGKQMGLNAIDADFDMVNQARAAFNVKAGDIIKAYIVDDLSDDLVTNPNVL